jgi:hypothetical protein
MILVTAQAKFLADYTWFTFCNYSLCLGHWQSDKDTSYYLDKVDQN